MPWVAREIPPGSKRYRSVNEPAKPHPGAAPPFDCAECKRRIGKGRLHWLLDDGRVLCGRCGVDARGTACMSRATTAVLLGIWP